MSRDEWTAVYVRIKKVDLKQLRRLKRKTGTPMSTILRKAIERYVRDRLRRIHA